MSSITVTIPRRKTFYVYSTEAAVPNGVIVLRSGAYVIDRQTRYIVKR